MNILNKIIDSPIITEELKKRILYYILVLDLDSSQYETVIKLHFKNEEYMYLSNLEYYYSDIQSITKEEFTLDLLITKCKEELELSEIVMHFFIWEDTEEGHSFWGEMYNFIELKENGL